VLEGLAIRSSVSGDIRDLASLDHDYSTDHVWQMAFQRQAEEVSVVFREVRLPRPMRVAYPRDPSVLVDDWTKKAALLMAEREKERLAYVALVDGPAAGSGWITDLVVGGRHRRQGIGLALLGRGCGWCKEHGLKQVFLEMQSKNYPAIRLAQKMGFSFAGYSDRYYRDQDIALFFCLELR
jgi:ribosomal protein S18 acetylase RimI-like enzyme